jgi:cellulose biosynthesis protein BcsQ
LLGGNTTGAMNQLKLNESGRTIDGYIRDRYLGNRFGKLGTELRYFTRVSEYNQAVPSNLFLLSGNSELDLASSLVASIEREEERIRGAATVAMSILKDILSVFEEANKPKKVTMFIDCNPSFAIYTELAVFASDLLLIPCTGDFASLRGINNVLRILYGINKNPEKDSIFNIVNFVEKAAKLKLMLPAIHLGIINKSRTFDTKVTVAYKAHVEKIEECFKALEKPVPVTEVKDCNNIALIVNYTGLPISRLEHRRYPIYGKSTQINESQLKPIRDNIHATLKYL